MKEWAPAVLGERLSEWSSLTSVEENEKKKNKNKKIHSRSKMQKPFIPWTRKECSTRRWLREPGFHVVSRPQGLYRLFHHLDGPRRLVPRPLPFSGNLPRPLLSPIKPSTKPSPNSPARASPRFTSAGPPGFGDRTRCHSLQIKKRRLLLGRALETVGCDNNRSLKKCSRWQSA